MRRLKLNEGEFLGAALISLVTVGFLCGTFGHAQTAEGAVELPKFAVVAIHPIPFVDAVDLPRIAKLTDKDCWAMVLTLHQDRFGLKFHRETREMGDMRSS